MTNIKTYSMVLAMLMLAISNSFSQSGKLQVVVNGVREGKGNIQVGLFNTEENFLKKTVKGQTVKAELGKVTVTFEGITPGDYAVSVIHDENENDELDSNFMGIPKEGFGFGNDAMGTFGPPAFDKAKIKWDGKNQQVEIKLKYY